MRLWGWILGLLLIAALAAWGWHWVAADPGYVLIRLRGWRVETTLLVAVVGVLLLWALTGLALRFVRWPFGAVSRRRRRLGRQRLADGLVKLFEGRHDSAERTLLKAARYTPLKAPAQLLAADAARRAGAWERALERLDRATESAPQAARVLRARVLRQRGDAAQAVQLLGPEADASKLTPAGWYELALAALDNRQPARAMDALAPLRKSSALGKDALSALEHRVLAAALAGAGDAQQLAALWRGLSRAQRNDPALLAIYAEHASRRGAGLAAMDELHAALRRQWQPELAAVYLGLEDVPADQRLRQAEGWLKNHPDDPALLAALGTLCVRQGLYGKARDYLQRALEHAPNSAAAWSALGDVARASDDQAAAATCYRNALGIAAGKEPSELLPGMRKSLATVLEERDEHGVPRLPSGDFDADHEGA